MTGWPPGLLQDDDPGLSKWLAGRVDAKHVFDASRSMCPGQQSKVSGRTIWLCTGQGTEPGCRHYLHYADGMKPEAHFTDKWQCPNYQPVRKHEANQT